MSTDWQNELRRWLAQPDAAARLSALSGRGAASRQNAYVVLQGELPRQGPSAELSVDRVRAGLAETEAAARLDVVARVVAAADRQHLPALIDRLREEADPDVLSALLLAIGRLGSSEQLGLLTEYLTHVSWRVRGTAVEAFYSLDAPLSLAIVVACAEDPDVRVSAIATDAMKRLGVEPAFELVRGMICSPLAWMRAAGVSALAHFEPSAALPLLARYADDPDAEVRLRVEATRVRLEAASRARPSATPPDGLAAGPSEMVRIEQIIAWRDLLGLRQMAGQLGPEIDNTVRSRVLSAVGLLNDLTLIPLLVAHLSHSDLRVVSNAVWALVRLEDTEAREKVAPFVNSEDPRLRANAILYFARDPEIDIRRPLQEMLASDDPRMMASAIICLAEMERPDLVDLAGGVSWTPANKALIRGLIRRLEDMAKHEAGQAKAVKETLFPSPQEEPAPPTAPVAPVEEPAPVAPRAEPAGAAPLPQLARRRPSRWPAYVSGVVLGVAALGWILWPAAEAKRSEPARPAGPPAIRGSWTNPSMGLAVRVMDGWTLVAQGSSFLEQRPVSAVETASEGALVLVPPEGRERPAEEGAWAAYCKDAFAAELESSHRRVASWKPFEARPPTALATGLVFSGQLEGGGSALLFAARSAPKPFAAACWGQASPGLEGRLGELLRGVGPLPKRIGRSRYWSPFLRARLSVPRGWAVAEDDRNGARLRPTELPGRNWIRVIRPARAPKDGESLEYAGRFERTARENWRQNGYSVVRSTPPAAGTTATAVWSWELGKGQLPPVLFRMLPPTRARPFRIEEWLETQAPAPDLEAIAGAGKR